MTLLLKRLFVTLALLGGLGANVAQATTIYYDFLSTGTVTASSKTSTYTFDQQFSSIDGGTTLSAFGIGTLSETSSTGGPTGSGNISNFTSTGLSSSGFSAMGFNSASPSATWSVNLLGGTQYIFIENVSGVYYSGVNTGTFTQVGAPEIDGSLAPKVGFLLGCLFLMFGRKKQNTETTMMA